MISFSKLGQLGRFGNSLWQIASMHGIAKRLETTCVFPQWKYQRYFKYQLPRLHKRLNLIYEPQFHYSEDWIEDNKDYHGWLQSDKYFTSKEDVKKLFEFQETFSSIVRAKHAVKLEKPTIAISIRRGDFVGNGNYELLPIKYYIGALLKFDYENYNLLFFSDDISYCRTHFECLPNAFFIDSDPIEQLCLMTMCENHIISNSTFSWWGAYLSESKRVIRPLYNFSVSYKEKGNNDKDYYCDEWEVFDHKDFSIPLDASFLIPVQFDHKDREENLVLLIKNLQDFDCEILLCENSTRQFLDFYNYKKVDYMHSYYEKFHRTKILNELARGCETDIICIYDTDVLIPPMQVYLSCEAIKKGADMVYPYDGRFARVPRKWYGELNRFLDVGILSRETFDGMRDHDLRSVGGAIFFNKESYFKGGGENENYVSYGNEDVEIKERFTRLGFKIERVKGVIYHIDHFISLDSYIHHEDYPNNEREYERVKNLTDEQLKTEFYDKNFL
jgi:hypothetical protein